MSQSAIAQRAVRASTSAKQIGILDYGFANTSGLITSIQTKGQWRERLAGRILDWAIGKELVRW